MDKLTDNIYYIELGVINDIAHVKLNSKDIGVISGAPRGESIFRMP